VKTWNTGYVFNQTPLPIITVFPRAKIFKGRVGGGLQIVEYLMYIDVYSNRFTELSGAKAFVLEAVDEIHRALKERLHLPNKQGDETCMSTQVIDQSFEEDLANEDRGFTSKASIQVSVLSYHERVAENRAVDIDRMVAYDAFFNHFTSKIQETAQRNKSGVQDWILKSPKKPRRSPAIAIMPGDEVVSETRTNQVSILSRPIRATILVEGFPNISILEKSMKLADLYAKFVEENSLVGGCADDGEVRRIDYLPGELNFSFLSVVEADFSCRKSYDLVY
jgi:hypothetical protein